ncbi:tripartite tricarboxylate transporter substrate binding protein [Roseococcus sp. DSY-14]|uniref:tripartite tricarboxylate transporter substrate binding protein n=1 Tax=Roseococcus sp. DSY-14 TaxID=3369650 RepID=UPI00387B6542
MTPSRRLLLAALAAPAAARAQPAWPTRPVRVINPYSPGGTTDVVMRLMNERLERAFGQPFLLESRPGAGGSVGTAAALQATDGHTLLITNTGPLAVAPAILPNIAYRPDSFGYVTMFGGAPITCAVRGDSPHADMRAYVAAARARPDAISFGNSGVGSMGHLAALLLEQEVGVRLLHVPYRGAPEAQAAVLAGDLSSLWDTIGAHAGAVRQGTLRALAFTSEARIPLFPAVPAMPEAGFPGVVCSNWFLLAAPASLPEPTRARINEVCQAAMAEPAVRERMDALGLVSLGAMTPARMLEFVTAELARWTPVARRAA